MAMPSGRPRSARGRRRRVGCLSMAPAKTGRRAWGTTRPSSLDCAHREPWEPRLHGPDQTAHGYQLPSTSPPHRTNRDPYRTAPGSLFLVRSRYDRSVRTVVVGSGVIGAWTALWLRRRGHDVTLVDRSGPGNDKRP